MPEELTPYAVELITKCPQLINMFADRISFIMDNIDGCDPNYVETLEPIEIAHVGYTAEQCGYDK